jgi:phosphodiesterase/alkaline phosphatase D-like protein
LHYRNINQNDRTLFRQAYSEVFGSRAQGALYANVPLIYVWDDHDFNPDNSDRFASVGSLPGSRIKNASLTTRWPSEQATYRYVTYSVSGGCISW